MNVTFELVVETVERMQTLHYVTVVADMPRLTVKQLWNILRDIVFDMGVGSGIPIGFESVVKLMRALRGFTGERPVLLMWEPRGPYDVSDVRIRIDLEAGAAIINNDKYDLRCIVDFSDDDTEMMWEFGESLRKGHNESSI